MPKLLLNEPNQLQGVIRGLLLGKLREFEEDFVLDPAPGGEIRLRCKTQNWVHVKIKIEMEGV